MSSRRVLAILGCAMLLATHQASAQDLSERLSRLAVKNAFNYVSPVISGWAADLNSGFYHSADLHDILGFDVGVKFTFARLDDEDKFYLFEMPATIPLTSTITLDADVDYPRTVKTSTAVGPDNETIVRSYRTVKTGMQEVELVRLPGGFGYDPPVAPLVVPQASLGLPFGLEVIGRFIPTTTIRGEDDKDIGKVNYFGIGLRHDIDQYIPMLPFDLAVHFMTQRFNMKDAKDQNLISASAMAYGVEASAKALFFTLYGGFQVEQSSFEIGPYTATVQYGTQTQQIKDIKFEIDGKNKTRAHIGLRIILLIVNVHADYSFAETPVFTVGAGITLR